MFNICITAGQMESTIRGVLLQIDMAKLRPQYVTYGPLLVCSISLVPRPSSCAVDPLPELNFRRVKSRQRERKAWEQG